MKEKELRSKIARHKTQGIPGLYDVFVSLQLSNGKEIKGRIYEVHCNHGNKTFTLLTFEIPKE